MKSGGMLFLRGVSGSRRSGPVTTVIMNVGPRHGTPSTGPRRRVFFAGLYGSSSTSSKQGDDSGIRRGLCGGD